MSAVTWILIRHFVLFFRRLKTVQTAGTGKFVLSPEGGWALKRDMFCPLVLLNTSGLIAAAILSVKAWVSAIRCHRTFPRKDRGSTSPRRSNVAQAERCNRGRELANSIRKNSRFGLIRLGPLARAEPLDLFHVLDLVGIFDGERHGDMNISPL